MRYALIMMNLHRLSFLLLACIAPLGAQGILDCPEIKAIGEGLGPLWSIRAVGSELILRYEGEVWLLEENRINALVGRESPAERDTRIRAYGKRIQPEIRFHFKRAGTFSALKKAAEGGRALGADYICAGFTLEKTGETGRESEFSSVAPSEYLSEALRVREVLEATLVTIVPVGQEIEERLAGKRVALFGRISTLMQQHVVPFLPEYPEIQYFDSEIGQLVIHVKRPIRARGFIMVIGRLRMTEGSSGDPERKEIAAEFQLAVDEQH